VCYRPLNKSIPGNGAGNSKGDPPTEAAEKFGIGGRTVSKAANVLKKGCGRLQRAARGGRVSGTIPLVGSVG